jgi:Homeodomain-like domain
VTLPPRATLHPDDLVTPAQAGRILGVPASTVRTWIDRYGLENLGHIGRWPVYDYNEIAVIAARMRRSRAA